MPVMNPFLQPIRSPADYAGDFAMADARRQAVQQGALTLQEGRNKLVDATRVRGEQEGIRNALAGLGPSATPDDQIAAVRGLGTPTALSTADTLGMSIANQAKANAGALKDKADAASTDFDVKLKKANKAISDITSFATPQDAMQSLQEHVASGAIPPEQARAVASTIPQGNDPAAFRQWKINALIKAMDMKDQVAQLTPKVEMKDTGGALVPVNTNPNAGAVGVVPGAAPIAKTVSPDAAAAQAGEDRRSAASRATQLTIAGIDPNNPNGANAGALSPAAIENAAARYNVDGTLPAMAMGPRGSVGRTAILNRAAELTMGTDPSQLRANQLDAKSAGSALTQISKAQAMAASFEQTANANAEMALQLSKQNDRTGVPIVNAALQALRTGTGSPEASQFNAANQTFVSEYAKIMSGGMGNGPVSDAASKKANGMLTTGMADGQYEAVVRTLQKEMQNRMKGYADQAAALRSRVGGAASPPPAPPGGAAVPAAPSGFKITHIDGKPQ